MRYAIHYTICHIAVLVWSGPFECGRERFAQSFRTRRAIVSRRYIACRRAYDATRSTASEALARMGHRGVAPRAGGGLTDPI